MLAGGWKKTTPGLSSKCVLSPPTVISGRNYKVHMSKPSLKALEDTNSTCTHSISLCALKTSSLLKEYEP